MIMTWPRLETPPSWVPCWLGNLEFFLAGAPEGGDIEGELSALGYFARLGMGWLDRTHVADDPQARRALGRALRHYFRFCDFRELEDNDDALTPPIQFMVRGTNLLRSLRKRTQ
jgi:hypothetical protein